MKNFHLPWRTLSVCLSLMLFTNRSNAQLSGSYTINPTQPATKTNYLDWGSAVSDLSSGSRSDGGPAQGSGVSGPVTFTVYDTVYNNTSITIGTISGTSATNTITFTSTKGDSSKCTLRYPSGPTASDDWIVNLNGAQFLTFTKIGFDRTGVDSFGTVIQIGNNSDNNKFIRCLMKGRKRPSSSQKGFTTGVGSCVYFSSAADTVELRQNHFLYGYNSIFNTISTCYANKFVDNLCDTPSSAGIYLNYQSSLTVTGNTMIMGDFGPGKSHYTSYALRCDYATGGLLVANNKVISIAVNAQVSRGFVFSYSGSTTVRSLVCNNTIYNSGGTGNCNGIALNGCTNLSLMYNNVLVNNSLADGAALFQYVAAASGAAGSKCNLINNNFINKGAGYAVSAGDGLVSNFDTVDYNNIYSGGTYMALWGSPSGKYSTLSSFKSNSSKCANCLSLDPGFISNTNLHVSNIAINGKALPHPFVLTDMDGDLRSTTAPDIGADEFFPVTTDAGLSVIDSPSFFCAGKQVVKVKFQNFGIDTLKSLSIGWSVNGVSQTSASWTGTVTSGNSSASISLGQYTFAANTAYSFKVWTYNPNGSPDGKPLNDTLKVVKYPAMSGNYTIGDTNIADYKSFNPAITAIAERGLCGSVTFNVFNGTYTDQIGLTQLPGMGSSSPITFQSMSGDSSKVRISLLSTSANGSNNAAVQLRGASYVTFRGITFERTGTPTFIGHVVHIMNGSHHNTFTNCQLFGLQLTSANTTAYNIWSDQTSDDYNTFRNNYVKWGYYSMLYQGASVTQHETGTVIEGNTFEGALNNSVQILYNDDLVIRGNKFLDVTSALAGNADVLLKHCDSSLEVSGNYFVDTKTANSLQIVWAKGSTTSPALVANNIIRRSTGTGISLDSTSYVGVVFNTINLTNSSGSNYGIFTTGTSDNMMIKNNNIVMQSGEAMHITSNAEVTASDYNNFLTSGTDFVYWAGARTILLDLQNFTGKDANSLTLNPMFKSSTDLHVQNPLLKGSGTPVAGVTYDFDGDLRSTTKPDIGADEFKLVPNDAGITELYKPEAGVCAGLYNIEVVIRNFGNDTIKTATVNWSINNVAQPPYAWTGNLPSMQSDTFTIGQFNFLTSVNPKFGFGTKLPNGQLDIITFNDSMTTNRSLRSLPPLSGGPDRTLCESDTAMLGVTANPNFSYQWFDMSGASLGNNSKLSVKPTTQTTYAVLVTNTAFGCQRRDSVTVNVNPRPAAVAGADKTMCFGSSVQLGTSSQSGLNYDWTSGPSGFTSTVSNPSVSPIGTTNYFLKVTNSTTNCFALDTAMVTVVLYPTPSITGRTSVCDGDVAAYSTNNVSGNTYTWKVTGGQLLNGQSTSAINAKLTPAGGAVVEVIESNSSGCKDTATYAVAVNANPVAKFTATKACFGSATIFGDSTVGDVSQSWNFGDAGTTTTKHPSHSYAAAGNYNTTLMVENLAGCRDTVTQQVTVSPIPVSSFTFNKTANRTYQFTNTSTVSTGTITGWSWEFGDSDTALVQNPSHVYAAAGNYTVKLCVTSADGCSHCSTQNISVVGLGEIVFDPQLSAVPNPGAGLFTINSSKTMESVTVTNAMGQVIDVIPAGGSALKIDLTGYASGIYFVKVNFGSQTQILRIIKQ